MLLDDPGDGSSRKEGGRRVKIVISFQDEMKWKEVSRVWMLLQPVFPAWLDKWARALFACCKTWQYLMVKLL